jgi:hypothetical protein
MVWESGARAAEEERGRVRRGSGTYGMLPGAVVCLPGRAYRLLMAGKNLDYDQLNTVSCGRGIPMLEVGEKNPSNHAIIDENTAPKTRRKTRILEKLRSSSTTNDFAGSDKQALHSKT